MAQISFEDLVNGTVPDASDFNSRFNALKNRINNGMEADNIADSGISTVKLANDAVTFLKIDDDGDFGPFTGDWSYNQLAFPESTIPTTVANEVKLYSKNNGTETGLYLVRESDGGEFELGAQNIVQVVNTQDGDVATGTTPMPADNSIPQIDEGDEYMTLAVTPTSATNKLKIDVVVLLANNQGIVDIGVALFQDSTAGALASMSVVQKDGNRPEVISFSHYMTSDTTSATTFKVRAGIDIAGTTTFNGINAGQIHGGVLASSITITEIKV